MIPPCNPLDTLCRRCPVSGILGGPPDTVNQVAACNRGAVCALIRGRPPNSRSRRCAASDVQSVDTLCRRCPVSGILGGPSDTVNQVAACNPGARCARPGTKEVPVVYSTDALHCRVEFFANMGCTKLSQRSLSRKSRPGSSLKMPWNDHPCASLKGCPRPY
jgi:hypothetical protein